MCLRHGFSFLLLLTGACQCEGYMTTTD
ncbi:hypothetical protein RHECNPAF_13600101 [Rhizobium etli CNPAF512]|nr:hypothetical protein RHECNPAF_13600101 [Rhizobium etli CNPAF512]